MAGGKTWPEAPHKTGSLVTMNPPSQHSAALLHCDTAGDQWRVDPSVGGGSPIPAKAKRLYTHISSVLGK